MPILSPGVIAKTFGPPVAATDDIAAIAMDHGVAPEHGTRLIENPFASL